VVDDEEGVALVDELRRTGGERSGPRPDGAEVVNPRLDLDVSRHGL